MKRYNYCTLKSWQIEINAFWNMDSLISQNIAKIEIMDILNHIQVEIITFDKFKYWDIDILRNLFIDILTNWNINKLKNLQIYISKYWHMNIDQLAYWQTEIWIDWHIRLLTYEINNITRLKYWQIEILPDWNIDEIKHWKI